MEKPRQRHQWLLFWLFAVPFVVRFAQRVVYAYRSASRSSNFLHHFGISEWLINYQGGFVRRGLPGQVILILDNALEIGPGVLAVLLSLVIYGVFSTYLWKSSRDVVERWVLLTTPFLGFPLYLDAVLIRKDLLLLVILAASIRLVTHPKGNPSISGAIASVLMAAGILSHEILGFLGLPAFALAASYATIQASSKAEIKLGSLKPFLYVLAPVVSFGAVVAVKGTALQAAIIHASWEYSLSPEFHGLSPRGAIGWIGLSTATSISRTHELLSMVHFGIPHWIIVIITGLLGVIMVAAALKRNDLTRAKFFVVAAFFQLAFMLPLYYFAEDHGRWTILSLISAFILVLELPRSFQIKIAGYVTIPPWRPRWNASPAILPAGFSLWGTPVFGWGLQGWLASTPLGYLLAVPLKVYSRLRRMGMPHPADWLLG